MKKVLDPQQMKAVERVAIDEIGIPSLVLMERAALACAEELRKRFEGRTGVLIVCGTGNNGADGLALARILKLWKWTVSVLIIGDKDRATEEWKTQYDLCQKLKVRETKLFAEADIIVDAIFGIGLSREITGDALYAIQRMNARKGFKLAIDVPSGISCSTGAVMGEAFKADLTVTFQFEKAGQLLYPGREFCGELICADIGIPPQFGSIIPAVRGEEEDLAAFKDRPRDSHKGTFGRVLVIAGSYYMCGAAYFAALAAYRAGAGLVEIFTPFENRTPLSSLLPEAILSVYEYLPMDTELLLKAIKRADAVVIGPGLSTEEDAAKILKMTLLACRVPLIMDADALNIMAADPMVKEILPRKAILTPHVREFSRLTGKTVEEIKADPVEAAKIFAKKCRAVVVLKDAATVVADPYGQVFINTSGCSGMATGGSGDVLAGIIGARCAQEKKDLFENAALSVYLHGLAGEAAAEDKGENAVIASDIADGIGTVLCRI